MQFTVSIENSEEILAIDFPEELTLEDLTAYLQDQLSLNSFAILHNGSPLTTKDASLSSLGLSEHDLLLVRPPPPPPSAPISQPQLSAEQRERFMNALQSTQALDPIQRSIETALEHNPESFTQIHMLYIPLTFHPNGYDAANPASKAFVDTGAQTSIISPGHAEKIGIKHLIDTRFRGQAHGVGSSEILGRIHDVEVTIGDAVVHLAFTVLDTGMDLLLGLDMMRKFNMCIDLKEHCLRVEGMRISFLSESESPKLIEQVAKKAMSGQVLGGGNLFTPGSFDSSGAQSVASGENSVPGSVREAAARAAQLRSSGASSSSSSGNPSQAAAAGAANFAESSVQQLVSLGFSRDQAIHALKQCNGNVEVAASLLFQ